MANEFIVRRSKNKKKKICTNCGERFDQNNLKYDLVASYSGKVWTICWMCAFWKFPAANKKMFKLAENDYVNDAPIPKENE